MEVGLFFGFLLLEPGIPVKPSFTEIEDPGFFFFFNIYSMKLSCSSSKKIQMFISKQPFNQESEL